MIAEIYSTTNNEEIS